MRPPLPFRPRQAELEWVGGLYRFPAAVRDGDAMVRPEIILWLELPSNLLVGSTLLQPRNPASAAESLEGAMKRPVDGAPRRPRRIRVADEDMAAELRAAFPEIPVVVAAVPELDAVFERFVTELEQTTAEPSYLGDGDIPPDAVRELFLAASLLFRAAPWRRVTDQQILRVDIPRFGIDGACLSVIGAAGESFGLLLFASLDHYERFALIAERGAGRNEEADHIGPGGSVSLRSLSFDRKKDLPPRMLAEIERHRWPVAGPKAYPVLFCLDGAQTPLPTTEDDVRIVTACTRAFLAFFTRHGELFAQDEPEPVTESSSGEDDVTVTLTAPYVVYDDEDDAREEAAPQRRQQVGRNDPCPCGSGKKYKKCHLDADREPQHAASRAEPVHERDHRLVLAIARFADRTFGPDWAGIDLQADEPLVQLLVPWVTWTAAVDGKRVADAYLERKSAQLSDDEREWFDAQRRAWLSVFEVVRVERGRVDVRDLLTGEERSVREELASRSLVVRDAILARILDSAARRSSAACTAARSRRPTRRGSSTPFARSCACASVTFPSSGFGTSGPASFSSNSGPMPCAPMTSAGPPRRGCTIPMAIRCCSSPTRSGSTRPTVPRSRGASPRSKALMSSSRPNRRLQSSSSARATTRSSAA